MIDGTFKNINRLVVLSFKNDDNDPTGNCFLIFTCLAYEKLD